MSALSKKTKKKQEADKLSSPHKTKKSKVTQQPAKSKAKAKQVKVVEKVEDQNTQIAIPFSDGLVSPKFSMFPMLPRVGDTEVDLLKSFLKYFSVTSPYIGTISTKTSFMKKKGGRLL